MGDMSDEGCQVPFWIHWPFGTWLDLDIILYDRIIAYTAVTDEAAQSGRVKYGQLTLFLEDSRDWIWIYLYASVAPS